jgi:hypothetical protein
VASPAGSPLRCCPIWARHPWVIATSRRRLHRSTTRARSVERPCPNTASTAQASARSSTARPRPPLSTLASLDRPASPHRLAVPPCGARHVALRKAFTSARRLLVAPSPVPSITSPRHVEPLVATPRPVASPRITPPRGASCLVSSRPVILACLVSSWPVVSVCLVSSWPVVSVCLVSSWPAASSCLVSKRPAATSCVAAVAETAEAFERSIVSFGCSGRRRKFPINPVLPGPALFSWYELFQAVYSRWTIPDGIVHLEDSKRRKSVPVADRTMGR